MKILVINLERSAERRDRISRALSRLGSEVLRRRDRDRREPYGPRGLPDDRRHGSKQRDGLLRMACNRRHRRAGFQPS